MIEFLSNSISQSLCNPTAAITKNIAISLDIAIILQNKIIIQRCNILCSTKALSPPSIPLQNILLMIKSPHIVHDFLLRQAITLILLKMTFLIKRQPGGVEPAGMILKLRVAIAQELEMHTSSSVDSIGDHRVDVPKKVLSCWMNIEVLV